ncbi:hypothetical protein RBB50_005128 [Rhinocladiella similis]
MDHFAGQSMKQNVLVGAGICVLIVLLSRLFGLRIADRPADKLTVEALYVYPVKGLRGCSLDKAKVGEFGFEGDRTFCLQKVQRDPETKVVKFETIFIGYTLRLALFATFLERQEGRENVVVTWTHEGNPSTELSWIGSENQIRFPLRPELNDLQAITVNMHGSPTQAYDMGDGLAAFFSRHLQCDVRLVYIGQHSRAVLGSIAPHSKAALSKASLATRILAKVPFVGRPVERIVFNDIAQYLVVTKESNDQITSRLAEGQEMDVTKFRPNVVVSGSPDAFVEDFWAELTFQGGLKMALTANCYRCQSITVDYTTGKACTDDRGQVWKKLNKDRRVDKGAKYSPVFGRYGFCSDGDRGREIAIGTKVFVTRKNSTRTIFGMSFFSLVSFEIKDADQVVFMTDWPNLTSFGTS